MGLTFKSTVDFEALNNKKFNAKIAVGFSNEQHHSGMPASELARKMEEGNDITPPRPFLNPGLEYGLEDIRRAIGEGLRDAKGRFKSGWANNIADAARTAVLEYIYSGELAPNAPFTIEKKQSDQPLVDTGELVHLLEAYVIKERV